MRRALCDTIEPQNIELKMMNAQVIFYFKPSSFEILGSVFDIPLMMTFHGLKKSIIHGEI